MSLHSYRSVSGHTQKSQMWLDDTMTDRTTSLPLVPTNSHVACYHSTERRRQDNGMGWFVAQLSVFIFHTICRFHSFTTFGQRWGNPRHQSSCRVHAFVRRHLQVTLQTEAIDVLTLSLLLFVCFRTPCTGKSHMKSLKVRKKFEPQLDWSFNSDTHGLKSGRQVAVRYYIEKWSHCVPFVFNKLRDNTYLGF